MSHYPLPMRFPVPMNGSANAKAGRELVEGDYLDIIVNLDGWSFVRQSDQVLYWSLSVADRLEYRKAFMAQVELANGR